MSLNIPLATPDDSQIEAIQNAIVDIAFSVTPPPLPDGTAQAWRSRWVGEMPTWHQVGASVSPPAPALPFLACLAATHLGQAGPDLTLGSQGQNTGLFGYDAPVSSLDLWAVFANDLQNPPASRLMAQRAMVALRTALRANYTLNRTCESSYPHGQRTTTMMISGGPILVAAVIPMIVTEGLMRTVG